MGHGGRNARTVPNVTDTPWQGDACSLVDAFRAGERSPVEELEATLAAIEASDLNCFSYVDPERARAAAAAGRRVAAVRRRAHRRSRSSSRSRAGRAPRRRSCSRTAIAAAHVAPHRSACFERGGVVPGRPDDGQRVRRAQRERHEDQRRHPQPVAPRPHRRRVVGRLGGGGGRRAREPGDRRRRRRLDPHPRRLHRPARHEGHVRSHPPQPARVHAPEHRRARQPRPLGARRGPLLRRVRRRAPLRPDEPPVARRLGGRARHATTCAGKRVAIVPDLGGVDARARRRGPHPQRGQGAHRRHRHGRGRPATSSRRTSPPSG